MRRGSRPQEIHHIAGRLTVTEGGCWLWSGWRNAKGYGMVGWHGTVRRVHRIVYEHFIGPIPAGLEIDHLCRQRHCANPWHMEAVTHVTNIARAIRTPPTHCKRGHAFTPENTYVTTKGRHCRTCRRMHSRAYKRRIKGERRDSVA